MHFGSTNRSQIMFFKVSLERKFSTMLVKSLQSKVLIFNCFIKETLTCQKAPFSGSLDFNNEKNDSL